MKNTPLVTIITPTTGSKYLKENLLSVKNQTYNNIQHLLFIDGIRHKNKVERVFNETSLQENIDIYDYIDIIELPYSTGMNRFNGHRQYFAGIALAKEESEYLIFLDEDNYLEDNHVEELLNVVPDNGWAFSMRNIIDSDGKFICRDLCESLGKYPSILGDNDYFVDVNCFFLSRQIAIQTAPIWYRKAREPNVPEVDRYLTAVLKANNIPYECSNKFSVNYRTGNTRLSVKKEFFIEGNKHMSVKYNGNIPWDVKGEK